MKKELIPYLGQGLQKYDKSDIRAQDPKNTIEVFQNEIWPKVEKYIPSESRILDVGCGNGRYSSFLSRHCSEVVAIDAFRDINPKHESENIRFVRTTFQEFPEQGFDVVFMFGVFFLQESWDTYESFKLVMDKLNPGGVFVTIDEAWRDDRRMLSKHSEHGRYNIGELCVRNQSRVLEDFVQANGVHRVTVVRNKTW